MQEQLVSFETAKLAKEKGFDVKVRRYFCNGQLSGDMEQLANWNIQAKTHISAPTQSLLQKWLRDTQNIHINIEQIFNWERQLYKATVNQIANVGLYHKVELERILNISYEEILEISLLKALELVNEQQE